MTPKRKAIQFAIVKLTHCRLIPTRCFSKTSPTLGSLFRTCQKGLSMNKFLQDWYYVWSH
ncbi:MAG: hypothetical protein LBK82_05530 [Planctomycetaceae bacterium]|nr:hypothetical protein [Planctomycetaceae bacterium]